MGTLWGSENALFGVPSLPALMKILCVRDFIERRISMAVIVVVVSERNSVDRCRRKGGIGLFLEEQLELNAVALEEVNIIKNRRVIKRVS